MKSKLAVILMSAMLALSSSIAASGNSSAADAFARPSLQTPKAETPATRGAKASRCSMAGLSASQALQTCRSWITYEPKKFGSVSKKQLKSDLKFLYKKGFRGLVTYTAQGNMVNAPKYAKAIGFKKVVAGIYISQWNPPSGYGASTIVPKARALVAAGADAIVIGNEGVSTGRYTYTQLTNWVAEVKAAIPATVQVTTSEPWILYLNQGQPWQYPGLMTLGDFAFPNFHPFFDPASQWHAHPRNAALLLHNNWVQWFKGKTKPVILKETWWPSAMGNPSNETQSGQVCHASSTNQTAYLNALLKYPDVYFVWGEAQNVPKSPESVSWCTRKRKDPARHWGLWTKLAPGSAKPAASVATSNLGAY